MSLRPGGSGGNSSSRASVGSGTYAARSASPSLGDGWLVTSGQRHGSYYECRVAGVWDLVGVEYGAARPVCLWDAETLPVQSGKILNYWQSFGSNPMFLVKDASYTAPSITTASLGGMPAATFGTALGRTNAALRTVAGYGAPVEGLTPPRSILLAASALVAEGSEVPLCSVGATSGNSSIAIVSSVAGAASKLGVSYSGSAYDFGVSRSGTGLHVILYTWDGTSDRFYLNGSASPNNPHSPTSPSGTITQNGAAILGTNPAFSAMTTSMRVHAFGVWDVCLSSTDAATINTTLAARFG